MDVSIGDGPGAPRQGCHTSSAISASAAIGAPIMSHRFARSTEVSR
jgi:hypothetical protein